MDAKRHAGSRRLVELNQGVASPVMVTSPPAASDLPADAKRVAVSKLLADWNRAAASRPPVAVVNQRVVASLPAASVLHAAVSQPVVPSLAVGVPGAVVGVRVAAAGAGGKTWPHFAPVGKSVDHC